MTNPRRPAGYGFPLFFLRVVSSWGMIRSRVARAMLLRALPKNRPTPCPTPQMYIPLTSLSLSFSLRTTNRSLRARRGWGIKAPSPAPPLAPRAAQARPSSNDRTARAGPHLPHRACPGELIADRQRRGRGGPCAQFGFGGRRELARGWRSKPVFRPVSPRRSPWAPGAAGRLAPDQTNSSTARRSWRPRLCMIYLYIAPLQP